MKERILIFPMDLVVPILSKYFSRYAYSELEHVNFGRLSLSPFCTPFTLLPSVLNHIRILWWIKNFSLNDLKELLKISLSFIHCWSCLRVNSLSKFLSFCFRKFNGEFLSPGGGFRVYLLACFCSLNKHRKKLA